MRINSAYLDAAESYAKLLNIRMLDAEPPQQFQSSF